MGPTRFWARLTDPRFEIVIQSERSGKCGALAVAAERARNHIFVLCDSSTMFAPDALRKLVRHFQDPAIGAVCGALSFAGNAESGQTEGLYWKYETALRLMEARLGATLTPSGAIYAVRGDVYVPPTSDVLVDDILTLMNVRRAGFEVHYDPEARAVDFPASSVAGEFRRRVRISTGSFRALPALLRIPKPGFTAFAFFSHKLLRWILPLLLIVVFLSNLFLLRHPFYVATMAGADCNFALGAGGLRLSRFSQQGALHAWSATFWLPCIWRFLVGLLRSLSGRKETAWQRTN